MTRRANYNPYKRLAAAVIHRAILDAKGQVPPAYGNGKYIVENTIKEAQRFLKGGMRPWSEILDLDDEKMAKLSATIRRQAEISPRKTKPDI
mgnify:FL=1